MGVIYKEVELKMDYILIVYIEDPKEVFSVDYIYIEKDTKVKETTITDIIITGHFIRSDIIFVINLDTN